MALESGNYINDLVSTNPTPSDPKSNGDDHLRLLKATIKQTLNGFTGSILLTATDTGTAAAHVLTPATALVGYTPMLCLLYLPAVTNTGAITVNVSGLGARSIKTLAGADPTAGDIVAGAPVLLMYNGTNFINLAGSEFLSKTGSQTLTGNLTLAGALAVTGATTLPANTSIGAVAAAEIAFVDGVTSPIQAQIDTKGAIAGQTWVGSHDFTGATPIGPTPAAGDNSARFATTAFTVALAFQSALPAQAGNAGKFITTNGSVASWVAVPPPSVIRSARTANTILGVADRTTLIDITSGTFTQTFSAAAALGSGWYCYLKNSGTDDITLDPNLSELIDGLTSYVMYPGECRLVQCDGIALYSVILTPFSKTFITSGTFIKPPGYAQFGGLIWSGGSSGQRTNNGTIASSGGGGGGCGDFFLSSALIGATEAVTIGAGGSSITTPASGVAGGDTSLGSVVSAFGSKTGPANGGSVLSGVIHESGGVSNYEGGRATNAGSYGAFWGGVASVPDGQSNGGSAWYGGGCGGAINAAGVARNPGGSKFGGGGGLASSADNGVDGANPAGGGGATQTGVRSGAGGRGELRIWGAI